MRTAAILLSLSTLILAEDAPREIVVRILATTDAAERAKLVDALLVVNPDPVQVAKWFAEGRTYGADAPRGWLDRTVRGGDGKDRPYLLYVPADYAPEKKYPFLVDMHGGVSRPTLLGHRELDQMKFFWAEQAEKEGYFLAIPAGEVKAEWWTDVGSGNVLSILAETRRVYNIDENRVFATGFSDGGSGSYYLALTAPTLLAGVVPLNGHIAVAQAGGLQVHLRNFVNVPMYAVNTDMDQLYPAASVKPMFDAMKELGAPVTWKEITGYGHDPSYLPEARPAIAAWMWDTHRDPSPTSIVWEGAEPGRVKWLRVTELGARSGDEFPDINPKLPPGRVRIGVIVDQAFPGPGVRISEVQDGSAAKSMGIEPGDLMVAFDGKEIRTFENLRAALGVKTHGDTFTIRLQRGEETLEKEGRFPDAAPEAVLRREKPYGSIRADAKGNAVDVTTNGIRAFELYLGAPLFDLAEPIVVRVNGKTVHTGVVPPDLRFLAQQAAADADRSMIYLARIRITVP